MPIQIVPPDATSALLAAGWAVVLLALAVLVVAEVWWKRTPLGHRANWAGTGLLVLGILLVYGIGHVHPAGPPPGGTPNPVPASAESIALSYDTNCDNLAGGAVVWHRPVANAGGGLARISGYSVNANFGVLRSRRA